MIPVDLQIEVFLEKLILETQKSRGKHAAAKKSAQDSPNLAKGDYYDCGAAEENPQAVALCRGWPRKPIQTKAKTRRKLAKRGRNFEKVRKYS